MATASSPRPLLWSTSRLSGDIVQAPLADALRRFSAIRTLCVAGTSMADESRAKGDLMSVVHTPARAAQALRMPFSIPRDRARIREGVRTGVSLVHVTIPSPWDAVFLGAARGLGVPIVLTIHDGMRHMGEENRLLDWVDDRLIAMADHVVCLSRAVRDDLSRSGRIDKPLHLLEDALLTRSDEPLEPRPLRADGPVRLLFLGRIHAYKGLDVAIDTVERLHRQGIDAVLTIAGRGDLSACADGLARLGDRVVIDNGWLSREDIAQHLRSADIMLMPYHEASQSGVAIDALWAALPTVATRVGALPAQLAEGQNALFAEPSSSEQLAEAVARIARDPAEHARLAKGAYLAYQQKSPRAIARRWTEFYETIAKAS